MGEEMKSLKPISIVLIVLVIFISSCTPHFRHRALRNQIQGLNQHRTALSPPEPYRDFPGTIHVHTILSHDSEGSIDEIVGASQKAGSRYVITTDHHQPKVYQRGYEGWFDDVLIIRGSEIIKGCKGINGAGCNSLLVLGLDEYLDHNDLTMMQVVQEVKARGGIAIAAHPSGYVDWGAPIDGMEIYDILDDAVDKIWKYPKWFFDILYSYDRYSDEVFLSILDPHEAGLSKWDELTQTRRVVAIAGNDAHQNVRFLGKQIDPYDLSLRFVRTHLLASTLSEESLLDALLSGHAYVSFDILSDATGFGFWAENGEVRGIMGDEISFSPGLKLKVQTPLPARISVIRDGESFFKNEGQRWTLRIHQSGVYRVEVQLKIRNRWWPWIYSNPIYVREPTQ